MRRFVSWLLLLAWLPWQWSAALAAGAGCAHPGDRAAGASVAAHPGLDLHHVRGTPHLADAHAAHDTHRATAAIHAGGSHRHAVTAPPASKSDDAVATAEPPSAPADTSSAADTVAASDTTPDCTHVHCGACCHGPVAAVLPSSAAQAPFVPTADARVAPTRVLDLSGGFDGPFRPPRLTPA